MVVSILFSVIPICPQASPYNSYSPYKARPILTNKELVMQARFLYKTTDTRFKIHWIKGHAGHEGNERVDTLANQGRISTSRHSTSAPAVAHVQPSHTAAELEPISQALSTAAKSTFAPKTTTRSRPWITDATLEPLAAARLIEAAQEHNAKQLRNQAKRSAGKNRVKWIHVRLLQAQERESSVFWKTVRSQRQGFRAKKNYLVGGDRPVPWSNSHEAFRDHLQNKQWVYRGDPAKVEELSKRAPLHPTNTSDEPFTEQELEEAISRVKNNKAPGPDDLFRILDEELRITLLEYYNRVWESGEAPEEWKEALVVSIYKGKGSDADPANYRPISLLNTIKSSPLCYSLDWPSTHGFRAQRVPRTPFTQSHGMV